MLVTTGVTVWAAYLIRKWKIDELSPHGYRWNFRDEGLFLLFWIVQIISTICLVINTTEKSGYFLYIVDEILFSMPSAFMVFVMAEMSFSDWSKVDAI